MLVVQHHRGDGRDGLGHRVDAEQRALGHRRARLEILEPHRLEITDPAVPRDGSHRAGDPLFGDIAVQQGGGFVETRGGKTNGLRIDAGNMWLLRADADDENRRGDRPHGCRGSFPDHARDIST